LIENFAAVRATQAVGEGRRLLCDESRQSADDGNHRTSNPPTLLLLTRVDKIRIRRLLRIKLESIGNAESIFTRVAGLAAALGD
jgi:hypothetical protein